MSVYKVWTKSGLRCPLVSIFVAELLAHTEPLQKTLRLFPRAGVGSQMVAEGAGGGDQRLCATPR